MEHGDKPERSTSVGLTGPPPARPVAPDADRSAGLPPVAPDRNATAGDRAALDDPTAQPTGHRALSAIESWLIANDESLAGIAGHSELAPDIVHLAAVLVLGRLTDLEIHEELGALRVRLHNGHDPLAGLSRALTEIRDLLDFTLDGADHMSRDEQT